MKDFYPSPLEIPQEFIDAIARESYLSPIQDELRSKTREQIFEDFRQVIDAARTSAPQPYAPMPSLEEIGAYLHRAANPTPADRAAATLNGEEPPHGPLRYPAMVLLRGI